MHAVVARSWSPAGWACPISPIYPLDATAAALHLAVAVVHELASAAAVVGVVELRAGSSLAGPRRVRLVV